MRNYFTVTLPQHFCLKVINIALTPASIEMVVRADVQPCHFFLHYFHQNSHVLLSVENEDNIFFESARIDSAVKGVIL